jgi:hypothetical protein
MLHHCDTAQNFASQITLQVRFDSRATIGMLSREPDFGIWGIAQ